MSKGPNLFEFGGSRFRDCNGLRDILSRGYFREGDAWGSIRAGWEPVVGWRKIFEVLDRRAVLGMSRQTAMYERAGSLLMDRMHVPMFARTGLADIDGQRVWLSHMQSGFVDASDEIWALCEAWMISGSAKVSSGRAKTKNKVNSSTERPPEKPKGVRRL